MPQIYVLDNVIRKVNETDASKYTSSSLPKLVIIDAKSKQVLKNKPLITFGRQLEFFLVSNNTEVESNISGFSIRDNANYNRNIDISVKYQITCPTEKERIQPLSSKENYLSNEEKLTLALFDENANTPGMVFERKLGNWLKDYVREKIKFSDFVISYEQQLLDLRDYAVEKAEEIGLKLALWLSLELEEAGQLKPFFISSGDFPVVVCDLTEEQLNFKFESDISVSENGKANAILNYGKLGDLKDILRDETRKYFLQNVHLYDFCYRFNEYIKSDLIQHLDKFLSIHGRKIDRFSTEITRNLEMPDTGSMKYIIPFEAQGYESIEIQHFLDVAPNLKNLQSDSPEKEEARLSENRETAVKYRRAKISDLQYWFREELKRIVDRHLFGWKYVDLVLKYDSEENTNKLRDKLNEKASKIGYTVRVITAIPGVKPITYKTEGFILERDEIFSTRQNSVKIKLRIDVRGKIEDLRKVERFLNDPRNNLEELIGKEVVDSIKRVLHEVDAADFYAQEGLISYRDNFYSKISVKDKVIQKVQKTLEEKFGASSVEISLQALNTELLDLINQLISGADHSFEILLERPQDLKKPQDLEEKVLFSGLFQINSVVKDQWDTFASRKPSVEDVQRSIQGWIGPWLSTLSPQTLNYSTTKGLRKLLEDVNTLAVPKIMQKYGLLVSIEALKAPDSNKLKAAQLDQYMDIEMQILEESSAQIKNDNSLRRSELDISLKNIQHLEEDLNSVREVLRSLSTQPGGEERKTKLLDREHKLQKELVDLVKNNRQNATDKISQQMQRSISSSIDESGFDDLVQDAKALLEKGSARLNSQDGENNLPSSDQVIDV